MVSGLRRVLGVAGACCVVACTVVFCADAAPAEDGPPYRFDGDGAVELRDAATKPAEVVLHNDSSRAFQLKAQGSVHGDSTDLMVPVTVPGSTGEAFPLPPGATVRLGLTRPNGWDGKASLDGFLSVFALDRPALPAIHRAISLGPAKRTPVVDSRSVVVYQGVPFRNSPRSVMDGDVRLKGDACPADAQPVRTEVSDGRHSAGVEAGCVLVDGKPVLRIGFPQGLPAHGTYKGVLEVDGTKLSVEARYSTLFVWPLLVLLLGVGVSLWAHRWITRREELRVQERILTVAGSIGDAQQQFVTASGQSPSARYSVVPAATDELAQALAEAQRLSSGALFRTRSNDWQGVLDRTNAVASDLAGWPTLAANLATARDKLAGDGQAWDYLPNYRPWVESMVAGTVGGTADLSLAAVRELLAEAAAVPAVLTVATDFAVANTALTEHQDAETGSPAIRERAIAISNQAGAELRQATRAAELADHGTAALVERLVDLVNQLGPVPGRAGLEGLDGAQASIDPVALAAARKTIADPAPAQAGLKLRRLTGDWLIVVLVSLLVLWAGFQLYLDKPWGTPIDYLTLAVWAYGAPTVLTPLIQALERLSEGPLRQGAARDNSPAHSAV